MKARNYFYMAAGIVLAAACQRENIPQAEMDCVLTAETSAASRTSLEGKSVLWLQDEAIAVFADGAGNSTRFVTSQAGKTASFVGKLPYGTKSVTAVYPYGESVQYGTDSDIQVNLPDAQKAVAGGFDDDLALMVASAELQDAKATLYFKQVCGLVKVSVAGDDVVSLSLSVSDGAALCGDASVKPDDASVTLRNSKSVLTLGGSANTLAAGDYYFTCYPFSAAGATLVYTTLTSTKTKTLESLAVDRAGIVSIEGSDADMLPDDYKPDDVEVKVNGTSLTQTEANSHIYEGEVQFTQSTDFTVTIGEVEYGFASYSGAGGIGEVRNSYCSLPYYNVASAKTNNKDYHYYVSRAIGQMASTADGGNKFFYSSDAAASLFVRIDNSGKEPLYLFNIVKDSDPNLIFQEDFDLCTCGGDYMVAIPGTQGNPNDGVTPGKASGVTANNPSFTFDYPTQKDATVVAGADYLSQRGLDGWTFEYGGERPGAMQLGSGKVGGRMVTPAFSSLTDSAVDAVFTLDIARFSSSSTEPISVNIVGGGKIESAHVETEAYEAYSRVALSNDYKDINSASFTLVDDEYFPHTNNNNDVDKPHSVYTFQLSGITKDTQIEINAPMGTKNNARCFVFEIKVVKK